MGLVTAITGRTHSLFDEDFERHRAPLSALVRKSRFIVIGAAGSIGSAFARLLPAFEPRGLTLVDTNENGLADLVRDLRSAPWCLPTDFSTTVASMGTSGFDRFLNDHGPFDVTLNFAALKHVRSERDPYSLMRMIETNVFAVERLRQSVEATTGRFFSVSSDKAVSPTSLMGATKRWMELVLATQSGRMSCTSARFANVAFSNGSLPHAFLQRLQKRQPLAAPIDVRRYFISHREAAQLCLLAAIVGKAREIFVPRLDPERHAVGLDDVARRVLDFHGLRPLLCATAEEAVSHPALHEAQPTAWPCYFSASDTTGEKDIEELVGSGEVTDHARFRAITVVSQPLANPAKLAAAQDAVQAVAAERCWRKEALIAAIRLAVPELRHIEQHRSLDEKI